MVDYCSSRKTGVHGHPSVAAASKYAFHTCPAQLATHREIEVNTPNTSKPPLPHDPPPNQSRSPYVLRLGFVRMRCYWYGLKLAAMHENEPALPPPFSPRGALSA